VRKLLKERWLRIYLKLPISPKAPGVGFRGLLLIFLSMIFLIENPSSPPRIVVITTISINKKGSFQPIKIAVGSKAKKAIKIPLIRS
jgi:hypothetical protein